MSVIGIDVGGTKIEAVNFTTKVVKRCRLPTGAEHDYKTVLDTIAQAYKKIADSKVTAVGIGTPGYILEKKLYGSPNNPSLEGKPILKDLRALIKKPLVHENDAKLFAFAEATMGAGKGHKKVLGLIIGTGVGAGIINSGKIARGTSGAQGEVGHIPYLDKDFEYYTAGPALVRMHLKATGVKASTHDILKSGSPVLNEYYDHIGRLLATIINSFNPQIIVLGGGVAKSIDLNRAKLSAKKYALPVPFSAVKIQKFRISDAAGAIGAALLAKQSVKKKPKKR